MKPNQLISALKDAGVKRLFAKALAANDNSKSQVYLGGDYGAVQRLPFGDLTQDASAQGGAKRVRLKADVRLFWILPSGGVSEAPDANLVLYPQYPEVRLSGFARGVSREASAAILTRSAYGRWLFLGITPDGRWVAHAVASGSECARWAEEIVSQGRALNCGALLELDVQLQDDRGIMDVLKSVADQGWIRSKRLDANGRELACEARNCGGYTLEASLGIRPNGRPLPDYDGWELKQFAVKRLESPAGSRITLMTPEPDGGIYAEKGAEYFVRRHGRPDRSGIPDRLNFVGIHRVGRLNNVTGLRLLISGWDQTYSRITDFGGGIQLLTEAEELAATWSFTSLINHWKFKHAKAVYVPSIKRDDPRCYRFGSRVFRGEGTEFPHFLKALASGAVCYDPGLKLENASTTPRIKARSQFRILARDLNLLYSDSGWMDL